MIDNATYDISPFNPHQSLTVFPKFLPFQLSETHTHVSLGVENIVSSKRKITESKSEVEEVTITKVIGNSNAAAKKTPSLILSLDEEKHRNDNIMLSDKSIDLAQEF